MRWRDRMQGLYYQPIFTVRQVLRVNSKNSVLATLSIPHKLVFDFCENADAEFWHHCPAGV
jgi:hypothetical protein